MVTMHLFQSSVIIENILVAYHVELLSKPVWAQQEDQFHFLVITLSISGVLSLCLFLFVFLFPVSLFLCYSGLQARRVLGSLGLQSQGKPHYHREPRQGRDVGMLHKTLTFKHSMLKQLFLVCPFQCPISALWSLPLILHSKESSDPRAGNVALNCPPLRGNLGRMCRERNVRGLHFLLLLGS